MTKVYTSKKLSGYMFINTSLKTGLDAFKPYEDYYTTQLQKLLNTEISQEDFYKPFLEKMRLSYKKNHWLWNWILKQNKIILGCDCKANGFCHAEYLAKYIFPKIGAEYCGEWEER